MPLKNGGILAVTYDVVILTDLRFPGGSSASTLEEVRIQRSAGLRTGLYHVSSSVMKDSKRPFHRGIMESILTEECDLLNFESNIATNVLVVRHPSVVHSQAETLPNLEAEHVVVVVNHPPVNSAGRIDYLLPFARKKLANKYNCKPRFFPIGPLVRSAVQECYDDTFDLEPTDWSNVFVLERFESICNRAPPDGRPLRIGRHSRPGPEKWPNEAADIRSAYLVDNENSVVILGGSECPESILGFRPRNWTVYPFGSLDVVEFLNSIDIFVYFHHPNWVEAFGRVIAEAMAAGLPTVLPHHFKPLFQDGAIYASPRDVPNVVSDLTQPDNYLRASQRARDFIRQNFASEIHIQRLLKLDPSLAVPRQFRAVA